MTCSLSPCTTRNLFGAPCLGVSLGSNEQISLRFGYRRKRAAHYLSAIAGTIIQHVPIDERNAPAAVFDDTGSLQRKRPLRNRLAPDTDDQRNACLSNQ